MVFYDKSRRLVVGNYDTFAIPFVIKNHIPQLTETFLFTIRRVNETAKRMGRLPELGDIVFQQSFAYADLNMITDDDGNIVGCYFYATATKEQAAAIPYGINSYDLAYIYANTEKELIPPSEFIVGEVLRYE